jgi:amino acid adenylation domain-containing protein
MAGSCLFELLRWQVEQDSDAIAILAPGRRPLTYGGLHRHVTRVIDTLHALGLGRGDRIAMVLPEGPEMAVATIAIACGFTCAPLNPSYRTSEFERHLADLRTKVLLAVQGNTSCAVDAAKTRGIPILELAPAEDAEAGIFTIRGARLDSTNPHSGLCAAEDIALALHTSGTSARPRLVTLRQRHICASACSIRDALELTTADRCLSVMPLFHIHGLSTIFASLAAGASVICSPAFSAGRFFEWMETLAPTWYSAAPAIHQAVIEEAIRHSEIAGRSRLRFIRSASSAMPRQLMGSLERVFSVPVIEAYGMTEAAPQIASNRLNPNERRVGSVGRAAGPKVAVVDEAGRWLPPGETGEIAIRGANVIEEYEGNSEADRGAFVDGWLRTGDLGHLDPDGYLFVTGRIKEVINRGGEKISPREVDEVLLDHPAVAQAATFAIPHPLLGEGVAAAIVLRSNASVTPAEIRQFAATRLAYFKVPQQVLIVEAIPQGATGKLERMRLAEELGLAEKMRTPIEEKIAEIWASVLHVERPGIHDDFFLMGGHSLAATQIIARLQHEFQVELPMEALFTRPTVAELAELVSNARPARKRLHPHRHGATRVALSFAQERLWFLDQMAPGNAAYNISSSLWLDGTLDQAALERSLDEIRRRHESLRTTFQMAGDRPVQVVSPWQSTQLSVVDLSAVVEVHREGEALRLAREEAERPFDLASGPLFRAKLIRLSAARHALLLTTHHIVSDGWSTRVMYRELGSLYKAFSGGKPSPLPELTIQYADFAARQREWLQGEVLEGLTAYWTGELRGLPPPLELPADRPRPRIQTQRGSRMNFEIPRDLTTKLKALAEDEKATLFMTLMAALQTLLYRYTGQEDFVVGTPVANRVPLETEALIGFFANTLAIRADLAGNPPFRELLSRVRVTVAGAYAHQDLPFDILVDELQPERDPSRMPLLGVMFAFQNVPDGETTAFALAPGLDARPLDVHSGAAKFDLTLYLRETPHGLAGAWQYNADLFESATIACLSSHFQALLERVSVDPDLRIGDITIMVDQKPRQTATAWRAPDRCFYQLFEEQAARTPEATAVVCGADQLTYGELNARANQLARHLQRCGIGPERLVGISLPRSVAMVVAVLAVHKAGGAYLPLDPDYPAARLALLMHHADLRFLLSEKGVLSRLKPEPTVSVVCLDTIGETIAAEDTSNVDSDVTAQNLAYVIYTSGSTGEPKGVMVTHGNVCHCAETMREATGVRSDDRYLHTASLSFSSSVRQLTVPLACGAAVIVARPDEIRDPHELFRLIERTRASILDLVPSYWRTCLRELRDSEPALLDSVRMILSASERLSPDLPGEWVSRFGDRVRLINMYGQTETTGIVTVYPIPALSASEQTIPIGRPVANACAYVLDAFQKPVDIGVPGEIYVGGAGVARGYLKNPDLTAERFVADRINSPENRLYRTGDRARYMPDGNLEFIGREDEQIKIRGFRIEPIEVETALRRHPWVWECAVVAQDDPEGQQRLAAFVVANERVQPERLTAELRQFLKDKLPDYMVPAVIASVESLPLAVNRKIDRRALASRVVKETNGAAPGIQRASTEPRTHAEKLLADVWKSVLRLDRISVNDNFFDLGGDSLLSVGMISRANQAGLDVSLKQLFQHQTIAELAQVAGLPPGPKLAAETQEVIRITLDSLYAWGRQALERVGMPPKGAAIVTDVQVEASLRGQPTHNVDSIPRYARRILAGAMNPAPNIRIEREMAISAQMDGDNGPGQWVAVAAVETAIRKAREYGVGMVSVRRSNHFGAAAQYVWMAAKQGLIGLCTTNGPAILAPTGGVTPTFGNNPLGVGIPAGRHYPILLDIAMSVAPRGKIALQLAEGKPLPTGWILDRFGRSSTDPADLAAGLGVPIGGHKGYGLALVLEALSGALSGSGFCTDHRREQMHNHSEARDLGQFFMVIDPEQFSPLAEFTARVDRMIEITKAGERAENVKEILIPGEAELRERERNLNRGVPVRALTYRALLKYAEEAKLDAELVVVR